MRIVFVLHQFYPEFSGGTEHVALNLARCLQRSGHYVHVLACTMHTIPSKRRLWITKDIEMIHEVYHGIPITLMPRKYLPAMGDMGFDVAPAIVDKLRDWMRAQRFDLMHLFHVMRMSSAVLAAQQCGLPYVTTVTDFSLAVTALTRLIYMETSVAGRRKVELVSAIVLHRRGQIQIFSAAINKPMHCFKLRVSG